MNETVGFAIVRNVAARELLTDFLKEPSKQEVILRIIVKAIPNSDYLARMSPVGEVGIAIDVGERF
ncbi:MAG: hypothetical protein PVG33_15130 [Chloroflexota bacterium]